jgi:hypothetical protein
MKVTRYCYLLFATVTALCFALPVTGNASTIPAGTTLKVKTLDAVSTKDIVGRPFKVQLAEDVMVQGKVAAPSGTTFTGKIITSTKVGKSPLSVDLTSVSVRGREVPVKTTGPIEPHSIDRGRRRQVKTHDFILPPGSSMQFQLAQAVTI